MSTVLFAKTEHVHAESKTLYSSSLGLRGLPVENEILAIALA